MKAAKWIAITIGLYVAIVVIFETMIGVMQPQAGNTLVIISKDAAGVSSNRVVSRLESDGKLYVATNHWPRAWYNQTLANPAVQIVAHGAKTDRRAVPVEGADHDRLDVEHGLPLAFRFVTGFPPRYFLRLDPR